MGRGTAVTLYLIRRELGITPYPLFFLRLSFSGLDHHAELTFQTDLTIAQGPLLKDFIISQCKARIDQLRAYYLGRSLLF